MTTMLSLAALFFSGTLIWFIKSVFEDIKL